MLRCACTPCTSLHRILCLPWCRPLHLPAPPCTAPAPPCTSLHLPAPPCTPLHPPLHHGKHNILHFLHPTPQTQNCLKTASSAPTPTNGTLGVALVRIWLRKTTDASPIHIRKGVCNGGRCGVWSVEIYASHAANIFRSATVLEHFKFTAAHDFLQSTTSALQ